MHETPAIVDVARAEALEQLGRDTTKNFAAAPVVLR